MITKRTHPMIGKLSELLLSGNAVNYLAGFSDIAMTSPRSPLEQRIPSPRGLKNFDTGGVGLAIVAALDRSGREIFPKFAVSSYSNKPDPVQVIGSKETDPECSEDFTYVTTHGPTDKSFTKVYHDREITHTSPPPPARPADDDAVLYPTSDFLSSCYLCKKKLQGKDIYMYRGEKGFCSNECRSAHIMNDERKEQCRSEISRSADISSTSPIFSTGILAI